VNAASGLTVPAEIIVTVAVGLAGTAMVTHDVVNVASTAVISSQSASERGLVVSATDTIAAYPELGLPVIELNKSNSRWYGYVSRRLRDLHDARYDFTGSPSRRSSTGRDLLLIMYSNQNIQHRL